ncbi:hypothetical protein L218DRAFT_928326 [Marasmius fiardii PR-910]|nr:hypothetical protein L218DRAFT_928326 [Marasmius fiardii PR-910]
MSLTASLGRELELYDQLCESIESHLLRAISILQRDLQLEQQRIKEAEAAALATQTKDEPIPSQSLLPTEDTTSEAIQSTDITSNPSHSSTVPLGRRPSVISISSLHRPTLPPKLDLSSTALRLSGEDASLFSSGLHSPVMLAPRSARPTDYTDIMAAFGPSAEPNVDIDLTLPDADASDNMNMGVNQSLGSSADKPIELDMEGMDMAMDLFGDPQDSTFSPIVENPSEASGKLNKQEDTDTNNFLSSLGVGTGGNVNADDIFSSLQSASDHQTSGRNGNGSGVTDSLQIPSGNAEAAPSPRTLIASFSESGVVTASTGESSDGGQPFDLDFLTHDDSLEYWEIGGGEHVSQTIGGGPMNQEGFKP